MSSSVIDENIMNVIWVVPFLKIYLRFGFHIYIWQCGYVREGFKKKKLVEFSTKKNNCLKHSKWPKKHFKTILFFSIFRGVVGLFTRTEFLSFDTLSRDHLATNRRPVSYRIRFTTCRSFKVIKKFSTKGGWGVRPLVEYSTNFFFLKPSLT